MSTLLALFETSGLIDTITSVIGTLLYPLFSIIFVLIAGIQHVFYAFAGIDSMSYDGTTVNSGSTGAENDQGILYYLLNNELVKNMLISIALLALFLVVIFTTLAFIKNIYSAKPKGWKEIVGNAIKGLANFVILPVCVLLGVWLGNILLQAINGATSNGGSTSMERKLFIACAYNANLFRCSENANGLTWGELQALMNNTMINDSKTFAEYYGLSFSDNDSNAEIVNENTTDEEMAYYANLVDQIFSETNVNLNAWGVNVKIYVTDTGTGQVSSFNTYLGVGNFYSLWQINYIVLIVGGIFMLYVLGALAFAMVKRLFYILVLFIISPGVCALYPLDEGSAVKSWTGEVKKQVLSAYGAVAGLNIFFSLVPLIDKIQIFAGNNWFTVGWGINDIIQIFILVTGLLVVKDLIGLISGFVGGDNAYSTGSSLMKATQGAVKKHVGGAVKSTTGAFASAKAKSDARGEGAKGFFKNLGKDAVLGGLNKVSESMWGVNFKDTKKHYKDTYKSAEEKAWEGYDPRDKATQKANDTAVKQLIEANKGKKIDVYEIAKLLKSIKSEDAKQEYERRLLAHNNHINAQNHDALDKKGKYIDKAKEIKDFEDTTMVTNARNARRAFENQEKAKAERGTAETNLSTESTTMLGDIYGGTFNGMTSTGNHLFDNDSLEALFNSRQKIDISTLTDSGDIAAASAFNLQLQKVVDAEKELEKAKDREIRYVDAYTDAIAAAENAVQDFASKFKFPIDSSKLNSEVTALEGVVQDMSKSMETVEKEFKKLSDLDKMR